ncbi:MAG: MFS transporter [Verrucomicrobiota bacterium]|nr:MFS transporter [Verrucomicrobiota bacterium]
MGPVLGGWLVQTISWRAVFFINLPIALIVIAISYRHVPESLSGKREPLDYPGAVLVTVGLGALIYSLIESSRLGFSSPTIMTCALTGVVFLVAFVFTESLLRHLMLPPALFRSLDFSGANLLTLLLYAALSATMFFLPLNLIQVQHYTPTAAGAAILPLILIIFVLSRWSGGLIDRYGAKIPLVVGPTIAAFGFLLFVRPDLGGSYWSEFFPAVVVLGLGMAVSVSPLTTVVMSSVSGERVGTASGVNNAVARVASLLAIAVFGVVILHSFNSELDRRAPGVTIPKSERVKLGSAQPPPGVDPTIIGRSFVHGFRVVMISCALLALGAATTSALMISGPRENQSRSAS